MTTGRKVLAMRFLGMAFALAGPARKPAVCAYCNKGIETGDPVFRPIGNPVERYRRLHVGCAEYLAAAAPAHTVLRGEQPT